MNELIDQQLGFLLECSFIQEIEYMKAILIKES